MRRHLAGGLLAVALTVVLAAACGDDGGNDDADTTTTEPDVTTPPESTMDPDDTDGPDTTDGPDGASTPGTGPDGGAQAPISRATFIANADRLCAAADDDITRAGDDVDPDATEGELDAFTAAIYAPRQLLLIDHLRALAPPDQGAAEAADIFDGAQRVLEDVGADPALLRDPAWRTTNVDPVTDQAEAFGFESCFT